MDSEHAKAILSAYRSSGAESAEPYFVEALEQARRDPELGCWFAAQQTLDSQMRLALQGVQPPAHLKESILAAKTIRVRRSRFHLSRPGMLALAACIVALLGAASLMLPQKSQLMTLASLTGEIVRMTNEDRITVAVSNEDSGKLNQWLAGRNAPHDFEFPPGLAGKSRLGCQVYSIHGNKVSLVCTRLEGGQVVHYFVIDRNRLKDPPPIGKPVFEQSDGISFATWSDAKSTFVMLHAGDINDLRKLL